MFTSTILPALAVVGLAAAQSATNSYCAQPTITINSQADASPLSACTTVSNIAVGPNAAGAISLDGPTSVTGSVVCENAGNLIGFGSTSIQSIGQDFTLSNLTLMSSLTFTQLTAAKNIQFSALQALSTFTFTSIITKATTVLITNSFMTTLDGINLASVDTLDVNNNNRLTKFDTQVQNVTTQLTIDSNGYGLKASFPNLGMVGNATFRNASSITIPSLTKVVGSIGFYGCNFESLSAPNLTTVGNGKSKNGGGIAFVANPKLANITLPLLSSVDGAAQIANNSALTGINFPSLSTVGGAIDFSGNFSTPLLPDLTLVAGGFNVQSTAPIDCATFDSLSSQQSNAKVILGKYTCMTTAEASSTNTGSGSSTSSGAGSSSTSKGAAASYGINTALAGVSVVGGLLGMLL